jgi:4-hydroxybenzoate polyprenyltransferase
MGLCRGLNLLLGVAAVPAALESRWPLALVSFLYIGSITFLSRGEVTGGSRKAAFFSFLSMNVVIAALVVVALQPAASLPGLGLALALAGLLAGRVLPAFWRAYSNPRPGPIRNAVRTGVLSLVLLDGVIGAAYGGPLYALPILATAAIAYMLARIFAVT